MSGKAELAGQTVVMIGGSSGIGLETARRGSAEGAEVIVTARDADRLRRVGGELGASTAAFDATVFEQLARFFGKLGTPIDHVLVTGPSPYYARSRSSTSKRHAATSTPISCCRFRARNAAGKVRAGGTLLFMGGTGHDRAGARSETRPSRQGVAEASLRPWPARVRRRACTSTPRE
jgi:hypothetical protein